MSSSLSGSLPSTLPVRTRNGVIMVDTAGGATEVYAVGGRAYPVYHEPQCLVCLTGNDRSEIERQVLFGMRYSDIAERYNRGLADPERAINARGLARHVKHHMPLQEVTRRALIEEHAERAGYSEVQGALVDHISFARLGLQQVWERMVDGELAPDIDQGIAFANFLLKAENSVGGDVDMAVARQEFSEMLQAIRMVCTPEQLMEIAEIVTGNQMAGSLVPQSGQSAVEDDEDPGDF